MEEKDCSLTINSTRHLKIVNFQQLMSPSDRLLLVVKVEKSNSIDTISTQINKGILITRKKSMRIRKKMKKL